MNKNPPTKYPVVLTALTRRKEGTTIEEFLDYNENVFAPLVKKIAGKVYPLSWSRHYHVEDSECPMGLTRILVGSNVDESMDWDVIGEMLFEDELHLQQFITFLHSDAALEIFEEEAKFIDQSKKKMVVMKRAVTFRDS
ncbi:hypothetical protein ACJQWK_06435 [Exserohilum turcicum]|uniref:EthD domain-containing protein n=1 Tax=Exserohilum turcicum (strain 28A) TaxID=671987 RepID=R0IJ81_EXST2|nr:uncharacterized protein SETTUDRAFT_90584 [Exserohilum turcica Et28A]EOA85205.1 hypothetical protein SETTUDRAFT_90584 [Exserohilum turcica Et28A]